MALQITYRIFQVEEQDVLIGYEQSYGQNSSSAEKLQTLRYHSEHDSLELAEKEVSTLYGHYTILPIYTIG